MYCPHCGKGEQAPDAYCRSCGEFLPDVNVNANPLKTLLGGMPPETQVNVNLAVNLVTAVVSLLLLVFLNGYFDAQQTRTGDPAPPLTYLAYAFLVSVAAWQFLSFVIGMRLKRRLAGRKGLRPDDQAGERADLTEGNDRALPPADFRNAVPPSVTEDETRPLDKMPRGR